MDLFFTSSALKRKNRKRKTGDDDDDFLLKELEIESSSSKTICEECGGTSFAEDDLGRLTCKNCGLLNEQQLTQSQVINDFDAKLVGRQAGTGHAVRTQQSKALDDVQKYHALPEITSEVCLEAMQWTMKKQASELTKLMNCDANITKHLGSLWLRFLQRLLSSSSDEENEQLFFRFFKIKKRTSSSFSSSSSSFSSSSSSSSSEEQNDNEDETTTATTTINFKAWAKYGFRTSLYLLYLACRELSEPVLLSDILRACCHGDLTYIAAYHSFPISLRWRCIRAKNFFCPSGRRHGVLVSLERAWKQCMLIRKALYEEGPNQGCTNWGLSVLRLANVVGLDHEEMCRCVNVWYVYMSKGFMGTTRGRKFITRGAPDIHLGAVLVVAVKLGGEKWYEKWRKRLDVKASSYETPKMLKKYSRLCEKRFLRNRMTASQDHKLALAAIGLKEKHTKALKKRLNAEIEAQWYSNESNQICRVLRSICTDNEEEERGEEEKEEEEEEKVEATTYVAYRPPLPSMVSLRHRSAEPDAMLPYAPYYSRLVKHIAGVLNCSHVEILREVHRIEVVLMKFS